MITIKKYFLSALILNAMCLSAMDIDIITDVIVENICDTIDTKHLRMGKYTCCFKSLLGSCLALYKSSDMPAEKAADEMQKIESYIPKNDNSKNVFEKLVAKHWYVYYLVKVLIQEKIKEFKDVDGSTIDQLLMPDFSTDFSGKEEMIYKKAYKLFLKRSDIDNLLNLTHVTLQEKNDIHFTALYRDKKKIYPCSLSISTDSKYLQVDDSKNDIIVWDTKTGNKPKLSQKEYRAIEWSRKQYSDCVIDETKTYYATTNTAINTTNYFPIKIDQDKPTIILYQRPTHVSYLCQRALENNRYNHEKLITLQNSKSTKALEGFVRANFEKRIEKRITRLSQTQMISNIEML